MLYLQSKWWPNTTSLVEEDGDRDSGVTKTLVIWGEGQRDAAAFRWEKGRATKSIKLDGKLAFFVYCCVYLSIFVYTSSFTKLKRKKNSKICSVLLKQEDFFSKLVTEVNYQRPFLLGKKKKKEEICS